LENLPPEKKEGMFFLPLHMAISGAIITKLAKAGIRPIGLIAEKPGLALAGVIASQIYLSVLSRFLEGGDYE